MGNTLLLIIPFALVLAFLQCTQCASTLELKQLVTPRVDYGGCINFSPYVSPYDPASSHPPPSIIDTLLDKIITDTPFRCIVTYGVTNGLNYTFQAAQARGISVIAAIWLDGNIAENNQQSIQQGIENIILYNNVIKAVICGIELRVRNSKEVAEQLVNDCTTQLRAANINKPIGVTDVWWSWVNQKYPYTQWEEVASKVDWIGVNIYPWWETMFDRGCLNHLTAPVFHIETLQIIQKLYPNNFVMLSEYGWPGGALTQAEAVLRDKDTGVVCATASEETQTYALNTTIQLLVNYNLPGIVFTSFREAWKDVKEPGGIASFWGICNGEAPFNCKNVWPKTFDTDLHVPALGSPPPRSHSVTQPIVPVKSNIPNRPTSSVATIRTALLLFLVLLLFTI